MTIERVDVYWLGLRKKVTELDRKSPIIHAAGIMPEEETLAQVISPDEIHVLYKPERRHEFHKKSSFPPHSIAPDGSISYKEDAINLANGFGKPLFVLRQGLEPVSWLESTIRWTPTDNKK